MAAYTREEVLELMKKKETIENTIKELYSVLESQKHVGMNTPLVNNEGYPRTDIDVYTVRHARHQIICLQNDHKAVMKEIESGLHSVHAKNKEKHQRDDETMDISEATGTFDGDPFAKVGTIADGSPAHQSGLEVGDHIIQFGSITCENFNNLQNIAAVVKHSVGKPVSLTIKRNGTIYHLGLVPQQWGGKGLLGCNIVPL